MPWFDVFDELMQAEFWEPWRLVFDETIVPNSPNRGWRQYIRNTEARFMCRRCRRTWPSNRVMIVFHMCMSRGQGIVKMRRLRQCCKMCPDAPMEMPRVRQDNIDILLENLVMKIGIIFYNDDPGQSGWDPRGYYVRNPHEPDHCEGCRLGICSQT